MKSIVCKEFGPPEKLVLEEVPDPVAGEGQVVIESCASTVTFPDALMIEDKYQFKAQLPFVPGGEAAGVVAEVGPSGHFFGASHTMARYVTAFYRPLLSDWRNFDTWRESGAKTAGQRAHRLYQALLTDYQPPAMDPAVAEELDAFVTRRIADDRADQDAA